MLLLLCLKLKRKEITCLTQLDTLEQNHQIPLPLVGPGLKLVLAPMGFTGGKYVDAMLDRNTL